MMTHADGSVSGSFRGGRRQSKTTDDSDEPRGDNDVIHELLAADPDTLLRTAAEVVKGLASHSTTFNPFMEKRIPRFDPEEITRGQVLGRGGFCVVHDISTIKPSKTKDNGNDGRSTASSQRSSRSVADEMRQLQNQSIVSRLLSCCISNKNGDEWDDVSVASFRTINSVASSKTKTNLQFSRDYVISKQKKACRAGLKNHGCYVVKSVSTGLDKMGLMKAHTDLAVEAKFLASLDHPNIINIVGVSSTGPCTRDYFLILDRMESTLASKIKEWEDTERAIKTLPSFMVGKNRRENLYRDRLQVSHDIACALQFLHSKNIIYRDLKPQNCGFDSQKVLRLFDFGLARELYDADKEPDGTYRNLTSMTGAVRYMCPRVAAGLSYNQSADVYSWAMLMFYMMALEPPFGFYTERMIIERSCKGYRPTLFKKWPAAIKKVLAAAWDGDVSKRPSFADISLILNNELKEAVCKGSGARSVSAATDVSDGSRDVAAKTDSE